MSYGNIIGCDLCPATGLHKELKTGEFEQIDIRIDRRFSDDDAEDRVHAAGILCKKCAVPFVELARKLSSVDLKKRSKVLDERIMELIRKDEGGHMIQIYLAHPLSAPTLEGINENRRKAAKWAAWLWRQGFAVECSWLVATQELEETPENRALGLKSDCEQVRRCDVMVLCGPRISSGMLLEASAAKVIIDFTYIRMDLPHDIGWRHGQPITFEEVQKRVAVEAEHAAQAGRSYAAELAETGGG